MINRGRSSALHGVVAASEQWGGVLLDSGHRSRGSLLSAADPRRGRVANTVGNRPIVSMAMWRLRPGPSFAS